ncbi:carbohydrate kinase family protein [Pseudohoeflea coraliihabitans]|uniref:Carbohydrate kinase n=1 Tax=Pseudohoeflea coraliihabitans TaxID=2860393 RepID=A0ABS6WL25_9HYPH|nr:carbohydrate kinase [Pseudohoeflea sp. DP4N28-3]MBW3096649.1 carbohydrate kinase [Pseudohoeflea sp. DP4N28-3]
MILCCGEALIDMIPAQASGLSNAVSEEVAYAAHCGGAVFNTAIALGRLGISTGLLTGLSTDLFGVQLRNALVDSQVDTSFLIVSDRPTTLAFVTLKDGQASYQFYDENSAGRMLSPDDLPPLPETVRGLFFGGISLACEPGADAYAALLARAANGRVVMLDPNIRPGFIADDARFRARLAAMMAHADIVKLSDEDLAWLLPDPPTLEAKVTHLMEQGPAVVIVTRGSAGAIAFAAGDLVVERPAVQAQVVDTVGAGDTFNAGVLAKLEELGLMDKARIRALQKTDLEAILAYGARAAGVTVSRAGANPPWKAELETLPAGS